MLKFDRKIKLNLNTKKVIISYLLFYFIFGVFKILFNVDFFRGYFLVLMICVL